MNETAQWYFSLIVYHGPSFGHRLEITTKARGRQEYTTSGGQWKGIGIPAGVLQGVRATVDAIITDHLTTRYGVQDELPWDWGSEVEPF